MWFFLLTTVLILSPLSLALMRHMYSDPSWEVDSLRLLDEEDVLVFLAWAGALDPDGPPPAPSSRGVGLVRPSSAKKGLALGFWVALCSFMYSHLFMTRSTCPLVRALSNMSVRRDRNWNEETRVIERGQQVYPKLLLT